METRDLIPIKLVCKFYDIPISFFNNLREFELIEIIDGDDEYYLRIAQIKEVEKMMRLHYDLDINFEGLDAIYNLLHQVESLREEVTTLRNKLSFYEDL